MKKLLPLIIGLSFGGFSVASQAENLVQVYQQARLTNPDLRSSAAERDTAFEKISEAQGSLLPQLGLGADYRYQSGYRDSNGVNTTTTSGSLQLTQTIFDMAKWRTLTLQEKTAGIQDVAFQSAQQDLILKTATTYFNVLRAIDTLSYVTAQKQAIYRQLDQTTQRFNVGLVAITDVQNARAQYDNVLANEVAARNKLDNAVEELRQVTGNYYPSLASLNIDKFKSEKASAVNTLLKEAESRNLNLLSARLSQDLAREQIRLAQSGHLPTLELNASSSLSDIRNRGDRANQLGMTDQNNGDNRIGVSLNFPIYSGGTVSSRTKQAQYSYVNASEKLESAHRSTVQTVRSSFNNINASVSSITAFKQSVVSAQSSLQASEAGYQVGTRTIVDVLDATSRLYNAKQQLSEARYDYLINQLNIKSALGTLNEQDLISLSSMLGKEISVSPDNSSSTEEMGNHSSVSQHPEITSPTQNTTERKNPFRN